MMVGWHMTVGEVHDGGCGDIQVHTLLTVQ